jgi:farnesyl diphosphate synthase
MTGGGADFAAFLAGLQGELERALERALPEESAAPQRLHAAMRYAVLGGGKRLRPALVVLAGELAGAPRPLLVEGGVAVELVHTYSLIHDDLPALDDDDLRRGRATVHRAFDEATAILAGDALLTLGLTRLAEVPAALAGAVRARAVALVGGAIGTAGMIGGQIEDLGAEAAWPADPAAALERIHRGKTAALIAACLRLGGLYAGVPASADAALAALGERLGLMFQIRDDLLDVEGTAGELGKTPGKDARAAKLTFPALHGVTASRARLAALAGEATTLAGNWGESAKVLTSLVVFLAERTS